MSVLLLIVAVVVFILGIFLAELRQELLFGGLAAFAAAHLPLDGVIHRP